MKYFIEKSKQESELLLPSWVNRGNASFSAYKVTEELYHVRLAYIRSHNRKSHFKLKKSYQISGSAVAESVGIAKTTLLVTSSYSIHFKEYLRDINERLKVAKENRLADTEKSYSRGPIARPKESLVQEVKDCRSRIKELEEKNAIEQVEAAFNRLHLDVKRLLRIDITRTQLPTDNIIQIKDDMND